jgi:hypothetical protein
MSPTLGNEDMEHILLKCRETKKLQQELLGSLWLNVNEGVI